MIKFGKIEVLSVTRGSNNQTLTLSLKTNHSPKTNSKRKVTKRNNNHKRKEKKKEKIEKKKKRKLTPRFEREPKAQPYHLCYCGFTANIVVSCILYTSVTRT